MRQQGNVHSRLHPPSHNLPPFTSPPLHLAVRRFPHTKPPPSYRLLPPPLSHLYLAVRRLLKPGRMILGGAEGG